MKKGTRDNTKSYIARRKRLKRKALQAAIRNGEPEAKFSWIGGLLYRTDYGPTPIRVRSTDAVPKPNRQAEGYNPPLPPAPKPYKSKFGGSRTLFF